MPNFNQLPQSDHANTDDVLPVNQRGRTVGISVAALQSAIQPTIVLPSNMLLGRSSAGMGAAEPIVIGNGLTLAAGTLSATATGGGGGVAIGTVTGSARDAAAAIGAETAAQTTAANALKIATTALQPSTNFPAAPNSYSTMQRSVVITRGSYPANGVFSWNIAPANEAFAVQTNIPATDTTGVCGFALAGYSNSANAGSAGQAKGGAGGVYGQGSASADIGGAFGGNFLAMNYDAGDVYGQTFGGHNTIVYGVEVDVNIVPLLNGNPPAGAAHGVHISGGSRIRPLGGSYAVHVDPMDGYNRNVSWSYGFHTEDGAADKGIWIGANKNTAAINGVPPNTTNAGNQGIYLNTIDGAGIAHQAYVTATATADLLVVPGQASGIVVVGYGAAALKIVGGNIDMPAGNGNGAGSGTVGLNYTTGAGVPGRVSLASSATGDLLMSGAGLIAWNGQQLATAANVSANTAAIATLQGQVGNYAPVRTIVSGTSLTVLPGDAVVRIRKATGSATSIMLEASPVTGATHTIKDAKGDAALNPITITAAAGTIDGAAACILNVNRQTVTLQYGGDEWSII